MIAVLYLFMSLVCFTYSVLNALYVFFFSFLFYFFTLPLNWNWNLYLCYINQLWLLIESSCFQNISKGTLFSPNEKNFLFLLDVHMIHIINKEHYRWILEDSFVSSN